MECAAFSGCIRGVLNSYFRTSKVSSSCCCGNGWPHPLCVRQESIPDPKQALLIPRCAAERIGYAWFWSSESKDSNFGLILCFTEFMFKEAIK